MGAQPLTKSPAAMIAVVATVLATALITIAVLWPLYTAMVIGFIGGAVYTLAGQHRRSRR